MASTLILRHPLFSLSLDDGISLREFMEPYYVQMRDTQTGEERLAGPYPYEFGHFWWTDGNMGCGCNRQAEWHRAHPEHNEDEWIDDGDPTGNCYHPTLGPLFGECRENRYSALWANLPDGTREYIDETPPEPDWETFDWADPTSMLKI